MPDSPFSVEITPDWEELVSCIERKTTPRRVHPIELFIDAEVQESICQTYGLLSGLDTLDPAFALQRQTVLQRFLGYDYVSCGLENVAFGLTRIGTSDTAGLPREGGRQFMEEHRGPITSWQEFEAYPWPDVEAATSQALDWYEDHLPEDMCVIGASGGHFCELLTWLMGYESLCFALYDQRDLVSALAQRILGLARQVTERVLTFDRVKLLWGSDDMGFRSGTLISPADLREFVLPGHKELAQMCHQAGRPYLLHSCGNLSEIMDDLIDDVRIDGKHSFEDTIETVIEQKAAIGGRVSLLGGIDMDFLCRATEEQVRTRVRQTLAACMPGGGYCLGTGNTVANYLPVANYVAMLDEGRRFGV